MNFNFNETVGASQSQTLPVLVGNKIHDVIFKGCEIRDIQGVKDTSQVYKVLDIKFSNSDGYYTDTVFEPKDGDQDRPENEVGDKKYVRPSNLENMMLLFRHIIDTANPELGQQIDKQEKTISATGWEGLRKLMVEATKPGIGKETRIKLIKDKKGQSRFPYFSMIDKETNRAKVAGNFIGDKLYFSTYEQNQIDKAEKASPTKTNDDFSLSPTITQNNTNNSDLDFNL